MSKRIVVLISGRGSNMQALVEADLGPAQVVAVISNRPDAAGLSWAAQRGIAHEVINHQDYAERERFDQQLQARVDHYEPDLVVLAGFMRVLGKRFTEHYAGRMLNIHPSLLPAFPGLHTHRRAIESGCRLAGCTVHFVTAELDHGPIVAQAAVPIHDDDTESSLAARVLREEHRILSDAVRAFIEGRLRIVGLRVLTQPKG